MREENREAIERLARDVASGHAYPIQHGRQKRGWSVTVGTYSAWNGSGYWASEDDPHTLMKSAWCAPNGCRSVVATKAAHDVYRAALEGKQ